jgi:PII-like signaling protein
VKLEAEQVLCRFHLTSCAHHGAEPLYGWIVAAARALDMQGGTVLKGFMGLRADGTVLRESAWRLSQDLPVILEVVDGPRHIEKLLARVEPALVDATVTLERAHVALFRATDAELPLRDQMPRGPAQPDAGKRDVASRDVAPRYDVVATKGSGTAWEVRTMKLPADGVLMRIFIGESDRDRERDLPLYESIVLRAREAQLAGATVLKGPMGFGRHSRVHTAGLLELSTDLPIVVEIVDEAAKIDAFVPVVDALVSEGLVTLEAVRVLKYTSAESAR